MKYSFFLMLMVFAASNVVANETTKLSALEQFDVQKELILQDINDHTIYTEIEYSDVKLVRSTLDDMSHLLENAGDLESMTIDQRADLFNQQELVNTILTMAENDSRRVCRRRGTLGTNFKTTTCETVKERRERQAADRMYIEQFRNSRMSAPE